MPHKPKTTTAPEAQPVTIEAVKGFNMDWTCRGFQYEIGKTYTHDGPVVRCAEGGFHACENPLDVWRYYPLSTSKFAVVEMGGEIARAENEDSKIAAARITIKAEIALPEFINRAVRWMLKHTSKDASQLAASGDASQLAASGNASQLAASGNYSKLAASGDASQLAASGDASQLAASGDASIIACAGIGATVTLGKRGTASLAYMDGKRARFLTIYEGEDGIEAGVPYRVRDGKIVRGDAP